MKKKVAILGFGKVGQTLLNNIDKEPSFVEKFEVHSIWNRSHTIFNDKKIPEGILIYKEIEDLIADLSNVDIVVECAHSNVLLNYGLKIMEQCHLFISSPTAFANEVFRSNMEVQIAKGTFNCYLPLGASVGVWDLIRLDQIGLLKNLTVTMSKHPSAFKIKDEGTLKKLEEALNQEGEVEIAYGKIAQINELAPQNTNTMSVYAMAASDLGFDKCFGRLIANTELDSHIVDCKIETNSGLTYRLVRDNPAQHGAVTGSATFGSFLNSLKHFDKGIKHGSFTFC